MTISIFDFDHTLYQTPLPTKENKTKSKKSSIYEGYGWWSRRHSIDLSIFNIPPNPWVLNRYNKHSRESHYKILMTGRIKRLYKDVCNIIEQDGLVFDEYHLSDYRKTIDFKIDGIYDIVDCLKPSTIYFYDDRTEHLSMFRKLKFELKETKGIEFKLFHIINGIGHEIK